MESTGLKTSIHEYCALGQHQVGAFAVIVKVVPVGYAILRSIGVSGTTSIVSTRSFVGAPAFNLRNHEKPPTGPATSALAVIGRPLSRENFFPKCFIYPKAGQG
jgi:hypothetical protein